MAWVSEYLAKKVDIDYTHKKQSGGSGQFGRVKFTATPGERGTGVVFKDDVKGGEVALAPPVPQIRQL